ncbi:hypothetical protein [Streptacidiphilus rugosus]|uniref:hypothetical protein n=1 Tax=Streptacidiphilus rugosus TaxID=405783 RepID=UPI00055A7CA4|nr:hypothetical protein [Streptacidiphilus rugosus]
MAWHLDQSVDFWTGNLGTVSHQITQADLMPGDILLSSSHTVLFAGWSDTGHTKFDMYEESHPGVPAHIVTDADYASYASGGFTPMRYNLIQDGGAGSSSSGALGGTTGAVTQGTNIGRGAGPQTAGPPVNPSGTSFYSPLLELGAVPAHLPAPPPIAYTDGGGTILGSQPSTGGTPHGSAGAGAAQGASPATAPIGDVASQNRSVRRSDPVVAGSAVALLLGCRRALGAPGRQEQPPRKVVAAAPPSPRS